MGAREDHGADSGLGEGVVRGGGAGVVDGIPECVRADDLVHVTVGLGSVLADAGDEDVAGVVLSGWAVDLYSDPAVPVIGVEDGFGQVVIKVALDDN